jgi:hypothetical protein
MELPEDIQCTIREFSRPLLPFVTEFKRTIRRLAPGPDMDILYNDIQKKLYTADGEQVIEAFMAYADAVAATQRAMSLMPPRGDPDWTNYNQSVARNATTQAERFQQLQILVYGERALLTRLEHWIIYNSDEE